MELRLARFVSFAQLVYDATFTGRLLYFLFGGIWGVPGEF